MNAFFSSVLNYTTSRKRSLLSLLMAVTILAALGVSQVSFVGSDSLDSSELVILVRWPGATPSIIQEDVSSIIESELFSIRGVSSVESVSSFGLARLVIGLDRRTNTETIRFEIVEALTSIYSNLPDGVEAPRIASGNSSFLPSSKFMIAEITSLGSFHVLSSFVEHQLAREIENIPGVSSVDLFGVSRVEHQLSINTDQLSSRGIRTDGVIDTLDRSLREGEEALVVDHGEVVGACLSANCRSVNLDSHAVLGIDIDGITKYSDIGRIVVAQAHRATSSRRNGRTSIKLEISRSDDANPVNLSKRLRQSANTLIDDYQGQISIQWLVDEGRLVLDHGKAVLWRLLVGFFLVGIFIGWSLKYAVHVVAVTATSISAIAVTVAILGLLGVPLTSVSLVGFALSSGLIVGTSVIVTTSIGGSQIGTSVHVSTVISKTICVARPLCIGGFCTGVAVLAVGQIDRNIIGQDVSILTTVVIVSVISGLTTGLLVPPVIHLRANSWSTNGMGRSQKAASNVTKTFSLRTLYAAYVSISCHHWRSLLALASIAIIGALYEVVNNVDLRIISEAESGNREIIVDIRMPTGTTMERTDQVTRLFETVALAFPGSMTVDSTVREQHGRVIVTNEAEELALGSLASAKSKLIDLADKLSGVRITISGVDGEAYSANPADALKFNSTIHIVGYNRAITLAAAAAILEELETNPRVSGSKLVESSRFWLTGGKTIEASLLLGELAKRDISNKNAYATLKLGIGAYTPKSVKFDGRDELVRFVDNDDVVASLGTIKRLAVLSENGGLYTLRSLVEFVEVTYGGAIEREDQQSRIALSWNYRGNFDSIKSFVDSILNGTQFPPGVTASSNSVGFVSDSNVFVVVKVFLVTLTIMFAVVAILSNSIAQASFVLLTTAFSITGAIALLSQAEFAIGVPTLIGLLVASGLTINGSILMFDHYLDSETASSSSAERFEIAIHTAADRASPILVSGIAIVVGITPFLLPYSTILAFVPKSISSIQVFSSGSSELQFIEAIALGVASGVVVSLVATLILVPPFVRLLKSSKRLS